MARTVLVNVGIVFLNAAEFLTPCRTVSNLYTEFTISAPFSRNPLIGILMKISKF